MSELPPPGTVLQRLDALPDPGGAPAEYEPLPVIVLRTGDMVRAYVNVCPHAGRPLCLPSGRTLVSDGNVICPFHGASFDIESGTCTGGPAGKTGLKPVPVKLEDGKVVAL